MPDEKNDQAQQNTPHSGIVASVVATDPPVNLPVHTVSGNLAEQANLSPSAIPVTQTATATKETVEGQASYLADESPWRTMIRVITARLRATSMRTAKGITQRTLKIRGICPHLPSAGGCKGLVEQDLAVSGRIHRPMGHGA
ncbi:hypothetical protein ACO0LG_23665 [Undibacterium sp. Ji42W]|uniref:hypothetical protein n=1 Tax=Undibacterium sp. Ji42W TaxID=3413039 RepID=UPI003BF16477